MPRLLSVAALAAALAAALPPDARAQALEPAPYRALPAGTVLDYGSWRCTVRDGAPFTQICGGPAGQTGQFFAKLAPVGTPPPKGYGARLAEYYCESEPTLDRGAYTVTVTVKSIEMDGAARAALQRLWPLAVGNSASFERGFRRVDDKAKTTIRVTGTRSVEVAGATHGAYVLEGVTTRVPCYDSDAINPQFFRFDERWWYVPALGAVAHYEVKWRGVPDWGQSFSYDLRSVTPPPGGPVAGLPPAANAADVPPPAPQGWAPAYPPSGTAAPPPPAPPPYPEPPAASAAPPPPYPEPPAASTAPPPAIDRTPPVIEAPASIMAEGAVVMVRGRIADSSRVIEFTLNGAAVPLAADGSFAIPRGVPTGSSVLALAAVDEWGNRAERRITVVRDAFTAPTVQAALDPGAATRGAPADPFAGVHFGTYHALVIGNNGYRRLRRLHTAAGDAKAVSALLRTEYGFRVRTLVDATRTQILGALAELRATLGADDNLIIYYAGHGVVDDVTQQGYWLPVDAEDRNPSNWISNSDLTDMLRGMRARHVMVVADSCYSGTLVRAASARLETARDDVEWIKRMLRRRTRTALVSGGLEPVADSGGGDHSVFAKAFLGALRRNDGIMEGQALFDAIKRPVVLNADQTPQYTDIRRAGHDGGEFIFHRRRTR